MNYFDYFLGIFLKSGIKDIIRNPLEIVNGCILFNTNFLFILNAFIVFEFCDTLYSSSVNFCSRTVKAYLNKHLIGISAVLSKILVRLLFKMLVPTIQVMTFLPYGDYKSLLSQCVCGF